MPEIRTIHITAGDIQKGDLIPRKGAPDAKVIKTERKDKFTYVHTDASAKALRAEHIQPMTVLRSFQTKEERVEQLRERLLESLNGWVALEAKELKIFIERARKSGTLTALEWRGDDLAQAATKSKIAHKILQIFEHRNDPAFDGERWTLEQCVIRFGEELQHEMYAYGARPDRSTNQMGNEVARIERGVEMEFFGRWGSPYTIAEEIKAAQEGIG